MARKHKHEEHVNHERWLVSYADFITLLFAFFVMMYAMSSVNKKKLQEMAESFAKALHTGARPRTMAEPPMPVPFTPAGITPEQRQGGNKRPDRSLQQLALSFEKMAQHFSSDVRFTVRVEPRGVVLSLGEAALFGPGDTRLRRQGLPVLDGIAQLLLQNSHPVLVEGHTDDRAGVMPSMNWRLSTERAVTVLSYLVEQHGYPPTRLSAAGYGQYHPLASNATKEGQAQNRRVDLVILRDGTVPADYQR
jgi:chemotaxis protein MotB